MWCVHINIRSSFIQSNHHSPCNQSFLSNSVLYNLRYNCDWILIPSWLLLHQSVTPLKLPMTLSYYIRPICNTTRQTKRYKAWVSSIFNWAFYRLFNILWGNKKRMIIYYVLKQNTQTPVSFQIKIDSIDIWINFCVQYIKLEL